MGERLFVAVRPPEDAVAHLDDFLEVRRDSGAFRWVPADQLHLTLAFMGSVPERKLDDLVERLRRAAARRNAVPTRLLGGGAFPHAARARVVWAGLDLDEPGRTEVERLATGARAAGARAGVQVDGARFRPHLTVARTRLPGDVTSWVRLLDAYAGPPWVVEEIVLVESHLGEGPRGRPRHVTVDTFALGVP